MATAEAAGFAPNLDIQAHQQRVQDTNAYLIHRAQRWQGDELPLSHALRARTLQRTMDDQRARLSLDESVQQRLKEVREKYEHADALSNAEGTSDLEYMANRLAEFSTKQEALDCDGSITVTDEELGERAYLEPNVPGATPFEEYIAGRRDRYIRGFVMYTQGMLKLHPEMFEQGGKHAFTLRPGVIEHHAELQEDGIRRTIVSANHETLIRGGLADTPLGEDEDLRIIAVKYNDVSSKDKAAVLQHLIAEHPDEAMVFVGDGPSDISVLEALPYIAVIYALKSSKPDSFDQQLTQRGIPHLTYNDFNDIRSQQRDLDMLVRKRQEVAA